MVVTRGKLQIRRVYDEADPADGARVLIDRVWPRGMTKEKADLALWLKEIAPSTGLRNWFGHKPERWVEFQRRYRAELEQNPEAVERLRALMAKGRVTLLYGARDEVHNQAVALVAFLKERRG